MLYPSACLNTALIISENLSNIAGSLSVTLSFNFYFNSFHVAHHHRCCILIKGWKTGCRGRRKYLEPTSHRLEAGAGGLKIQKVKVKLSDDRQRERWEIPLLKQTAKLWICVFKRACGRSCMNFLPELANWFWLVNYENKLAHILPFT